MTTAQTLTNLTHKALLAVALLCTAVAFYMWGRHLFLINGAMSMARAFTWTFLMLVTHAIAGLVEWYGGV